MVRHAVHDGFLRPGTASFRATRLGVRRHNIWGLLLAGPPVYGGSTRFNSGGNIAADWGRSTADEERSVMDFDSTESIDGYAIPVDPMDLLQCDSCQ